MPHCLSPPQRFLSSDLVNTLETYLNAEQVHQVYAAYLFAAEAHDGQMRHSGEPYIFHPLAVAKILADMRLDHTTLMAALLHDVIEDTATAKEHLAQHFGSEVAHLVDGVSKLAKVHFASHAKSQAENFQKMFLAMAQDLRVILIKLADRLHNMRTLSAMKRDSARRKAFETLEIYVPIAQRLGIACLRWELEHLCFATLYPWRYRVIQHAVKRIQMQRTERVNQILTTIKQRFSSHEIDATVGFEALRVFTLYRNAKRKLATFRNALDQIEIRVTVQNNQIGDCYRALGALHSSYKPVPGSFKDYLAIPKANGYQALHTLLACSEELKILVRIQSLEMDQIANMGIAAHWVYTTRNQTAQHTPHHRAKEWIKNLLDIQKGGGDSLEFLNNVKMDLFPDEVYVFTPKGEIIILPRGATPVDLAYTIHTDIGNTCVGAKINNRRVNLFTPLLNGQSVQILTHRQAHPDPAWLNFVVTSRAHTSIRVYLKNLQAREAYNLGKTWLEAVLKNYGLTLEDIPTQRLHQLLSDWHLDSLNVLLQEIGLGKRMAPLVARYLVPDDHKPQTNLSSVLAIKNTEGLAVSFAACCHPIPGDDIVGVFSPGLGVVVHLTHCPTLGTPPDEQPAEQRVVIEWCESIQQELPVEIGVQVTEQRGVLALVSAAIAEQQANIEQLAIESQKDGTRLLKFTISVRNRTHLADILREIKTIPAVNSVARSTTHTAKKIHRSLRERRLSQLF